MGGRAGLRSALEYSAGLRNAAEGRPALTGLSQDLERRGCIRRGLRDRRRADAPSLVAWSRIRHAVDAGRQYIERLEAAPGVRTRKRTVRTRSTSRSAATHGHS